MQDPEDCGFWQCGSSKLIWETAADNCEVYFIRTKMPRNIFDFLCGSKLRISPIPQILWNHWDSCERQLEMIMGMVKEASESIRACALGGSVGGRNVKGSAFALTIDQRPSGVVVSTEKGPGLSAFVLLVSACSHQHARGGWQRAVPALANHSSSQVFGSLQRSWQPHACSMVRVWGQACAPTILSCTQDILAEAEKLGKLIKQNPSMEKPWPWLQIYKGLREKSFWTMCLFCLFMMMIEKSNSKTFTCLPLV